MKDDLDLQFKQALAGTLDMAVDSLLQVIEFDSGVDNLITKKLSKEQVDELIFWFDDEVIPIYTELKMLDKVKKVEGIKNTIKEQCYKEERKAEEEKERKKLKQKEKIGWNCIINNNCLKKPCWNCS